MEPLNSYPNNRRKALTSIHDAYTLSPTPEGANNADELNVKNFLNTLAEIALSVAQRKQRIKDD